MQRKDITSALETALNSEALASPTRHVSKHFASQSCMKGLSLWSLYDSGVHEQDHMKQNKWQEFLGAFGTECNHSKSRLKEMSTARIKHLETQFPRHGRVFQSQLLFAVGLKKLY